MIGLIDLSVVDLSVDRIRLMDGLDMLSRGLEPRCRSEHLGQLDWSDARADGCHHVPPLAAAEGRDSGITQHTQAC